MGLSPTGFDSECRFVTSWLLPPILLASLRALLCTYCFATTFTKWGWSGTHHDPAAIGREFSYFTVLTYWGLTFYMLVACVHTFVYALRGRYWLKSFPRPLQALHSLFYTTVVTYPFLVTAVYWGVLYRGPWFKLTFNGWSNVQKPPITCFVPQ